MRLTLLNLALIIILCSNAFAGLPVSTEPQPRNALLEVFTGIYCGYCKEGHKIAEEIMEENPGRVFTINYHIDDPVTDTRPDYRTKYCRPLYDMCCATGIPTAMINRIHNSFDSYYFSRISWKSKVKNELAKTSPVNIAAEADWLTCRTIKVDIEMYFTEDAPPDNLLNVALIENGIIGYQVGDWEYEHNHMLRNMTGQWGELIPESSKGSLVKRTVYINTIDSINPWQADLDIVVYLTQNSHDQIYTATQVHIEETAPASQYSAHKIQYEQIVGSENTMSQAGVIFTNESDEDMEIHLRTRKSETIPEDWPCEIYGDLDSVITVPPGDQTTYKAVFKIGKTPGYGEMSFDVLKKVNDDYLEPTTVTSKMISTDYTDMYVVAAYRGPMIGNLIGETSLKDLPKLPYEYFELGTNQFNNVKTLVWEAGNAGHLEQKTAKFFYRTLLHGGNVLLFGNHLESYCKAEKVLSYLKLNHIGMTKAGSNGAPFTITGYSGDPVTGDYTELYPSTTKYWSINIFEITDQSATKPIMRLGEDCIWTENSVDHEVDAEDALIGFRFNKDQQRVVYLSESLNIIKDEEIGIQLTKTILNYVGGSISVEEFDRSCHEILASPNPTSQNSEIQFYMQNAAHVNVSIIDINGISVRDCGQRTAISGLNKLHIDCIGLPSGMYYCVVQCPVEKQVVKLVIER